MELDKESKSFFNYSIITHPILFIMSILFIMGGLIISIYNMKLDKINMVLGLIIAMNGVTIWNNIWYEFKEWSLALIIDELIIGLLGGQDEIDKMIKEGKINDKKK